MDRRAVARKEEQVEVAEKVQGGGGNPAAIVSGILQRVDKDGDGKISKDEAAADDRMNSSFATTIRMATGPSMLRNSKRWPNALVAGRSGGKGGGWG